MSLGQRSPRLSSRSLLVPALAAVLAGALFLAAPRAQAYELGVFLHQNSLRPSATGAATSYETRKDRGLGMGASLGFALEGPLQLEIDLIEAHYGYGVDSSRTTPAFVNTVSWRALQVPLMLRAEPLRLLSLGAGVYGSQALSDKRVDSSTGQVTMVPLETKAQTDWGLAAAAGLRVPIGGPASGFRFVAEGRYLRGMKDVSDTPGTTLRLNQFQILGGFSFDPR